MHIASPPPHPQVVYFFPFEPDVEGTLNDMQLKCHKTVHMSISSQPSPSSQFGFGMPYSLTTVPATTSSQVLCGPEICCKSLADFFLIRNILKECDSCSHIFLILIGKHAHTLFIFVRQSFFFQNTRSRSSDAISGELKLTMPPNATSLAARIREKRKRGFQEPKEAQLMQ
jgi:hypothetical protein